MYISDPDRYWDEVCELARQDARLDALLHTTICVTMAQGTQQPNVIPAHVSATISARVLPGETGMKFWRISSSTSPVAFRSAAYPASTRSTQTPRTVKNSVWSNRLFTTYTVMTSSSCRN